MNDFIAATKLLSRTLRPLICILYSVISLFLVISFFAVNLR